MTGSSRFGNRALWCSIATLAIAVFLLVPQNEERSHGPPTFLEGLDIPARSFPVTYQNEATLESFERINLPDDNSTTPDVTAIILNWARFPNVVRIVSLLCGTSLDNTIASILIWNNSPNRLKRKDIPSCRKLRIHNSPSNLYFHARFLACAESSTPYCFIQDDDYLVLPEIIRALRHRIEDEIQQGFHLLPPHEMLSTRLRSLHIKSKNIHTSHAWLGHGTLIPRSMAVNFLSLMGDAYLNVSNTELRMADNYFSILSNRVPETWFDQGIELDGGQPFTSGHEGDERNRIHFMKAAKYLDSVMGCYTPPCLNISSRKSDASRGRLPFINTEASSSSDMTVAYAPSLGTSGLLETTIRLLPSLVSSAEAASDMFQIEEFNLGVLGELRRSYYLSFPPSQAVDGRPDTAFRSPENARDGETISLVLLRSIERNWRNVEMSWLVDDGTRRILRGSVFETSLDGVRWVSSPHPISCLKTTVPSTGSIKLVEPHLIECSVPMFSDRSRSNARFFRARAEAPVKEQWCVYEVWLRGMS